MNIGELIEILKDYPKDVRVLTSGYEGGYNDVDIQPLSVYAENVNTAWYYGPHEEVMQVGRYEDKVHFMGVVL